ncbi:MAG: spore coat protein CotJB [Lachnospirales bacterium]
MNRNELLKRLTILDFLSVDLQLYLDTHPDDKDAIEKYNSVIKEADTIRAMLEKMNGPIYSFRSYSNDDEFSWVDNPWPWEMDFNFDI